MTTWPASIELVRHGESVGNVANAAAYASGALRLDLDLADPDVPITARGVAQARALGRHLGASGPGGRPDVCIVSTYLRARQTAEQLITAAGWDGVEVRHDERLRDREQGILDRLTIQGIRAAFPAEAARRDALGKFYFRPPGGESWADVVLRIRSLLTDLRLERAGDRVLLVTHDVPILSARYILERLSIAEALALSGKVHNCGRSVFTAGHDAGPDDAMMLHVFNDVRPIEDDDAAEATRHGERP